MGLQLGEPKQINTSVEVHIGIIGEAKQGGRHISRRLLNGHVGAILGHVVLGGERSNVNRLQVNWENRFQIGIVLFFCKNATCHPKTPNLYN